MKAFDEVKKLRCKLLYKCKLFGHMENWRSGCEAGLGGIVRE